MSFSFLSFISQSSLHTSFSLLPGFVFIDAVYSFLFLCLFFSYFPKRLHITYFFSLLSTFHFLSFSLIIFHFPSVFLNPSLWTSYFFPLSFVFSSHFFSSLVFPSLPILARFPSLSFNLSYSLFFLSFPTHFPQLCSNFRPFYTTFVFLPSLLYPFLYPLLPSCLHLSRFSSLRTPPSPTLSLSFPNSLFSVIFFLPSSLPLYGQRFCCHGWKMRDWLWM